jgi:predicted DNA-binding protein (MmcQ/YjbR family)
MGKKQSPKSVRRLLLAKPGAAGSYPFGEGALVFKIGGKMFALIGEDARPETINLKCDPDEALALRAAHPGSITAGYHMNKRHWNTVLLDESLPDSLVAEMIEHSYQLVLASLPKAAREKISRKAGRD